MNAGKYRKWNINVSLSNFTGLRSRAKLAEEFNWKFSSTIFLYFVRYYQMGDNICSFDSWKRGMENGDDWLAIDKLQHFLFCFSLTVLFSTVAARTPYPFIRSRSIWIGSLASLAAGAAKEAADEIGLFKSAGASFKDGVADLFGVLVASLVLYLCRSFSLRSKSDLVDRAILLV